MSYFLIKIHGNSFEIIYILGYTSKQSPVEGKHILPLPFSHLGVFPERIAAVIKHDLLALIENKRTELIKVANTNGLTSTLAIRYSQELDYLLNEYNRKYKEKVSS